MHDGSPETLYDVVEVFNKGGQPNQYLDREMKPLGLTPAAVDDLCSFMGALTSDRFSAQGGPELDRQHATYLYQAAQRRAAQNKSR